MKYSVALSERIDQLLRDHLLQTRGQEDICFALYNISRGKNRITGVVIDVLVPSEVERNLHGNVSFNAVFWDRVTSEALRMNCGICIIHSHLGPGWQRMSEDDENAERGLAGPAYGTTSLPLIGMTLGTDGVWSARFWPKCGYRKFIFSWCDSVRVVGIGFKIHYLPTKRPPQKIGDEFARTVSAWGMLKQYDLTQLTVGVIGLGSVGSIIAEALLRTGIKTLILIDFDRVELRNLDRLLGFTKKDIGKLKVTCIKTRLESIHLQKNVQIVTVPLSITDEGAIKIALDCDLLFSCVDRPWPRFILDCISLSNVIPVIDGGIDASINEKQSNLDQARWKTHVVAPGRACMQCIGQYVPEDVALEQSGLLDDPAYIKGLLPHHWINRGENVFAFSLCVAGLLMQQFLSLILQPRGLYYGPKEYDFNSGNIDYDFPFSCAPSCRICATEASGDKTNTVLTRN